MLKLILDVEKGDTLQKAAAHLHFPFTGQNQKQRLFRLILTKRRQTYYPMLGFFCQTDKRLKVTTEMLSTLLHCGTDD